MSVTTHERTIQFIESNGGQIISTNQLNGRHFFQITVPEDFDLFHPKRTEINMFHTRKKQNLAVVQFNWHCFAVFGFCGPLLPQ
jgi:hypothetical protein